MTIAIDVGGTFTDFVVRSGDKHVEHFKVPSTPESPEKAVSGGVERVEELGGEVFHGSTVATNAFLEGRGSDAAFLTNRGFEDTLYIGRQKRPCLYDLHVSKEKPPLNPDDCYGIPGRIDEKGRIVEKLDEDHAERTAEKLKREGKSAAVCFLHSYINPEHEEKVGKILGEYGVPFSLSSCVTGEFREYERGMTTLMDAYLSPLVGSYLETIEGMLDREPLIMKSSGGLERASSVDPVSMFLSGPAGGVAGGAYISEETGVDDLITFDMGGTSADVATVRNGEIAWKDEGRIGDFPVQKRMVDILSIGSGGGSVAWIDEGGALKVGPESSGAIPGPACYGRGGTDPTLTDALLQLGYIDASFFLGGKMKLDEKASKTVLKELAQDLGMNVEETSLGIFRVANSKMKRAMKRVTVEKGLDPESFSILAFGGAGPIHGPFLAEELGVAHVMIPPTPGVFSAFGMMAGDIVRDFSRTVITPLSDRGEIVRAVEDLREEAPEVGTGRVLLGLRYEGQSHHLNIPFKPGEMAERFHQAHKEKHGYSNRHAEIEVVRVHLEVREEKSVEKIPVRVGGREKEMEKRCLFPGEGWMETDLYMRENLPSGPEGEGPVIVADVNSTCVVPPGWMFSVDSNEVLHLRWVDA
ncbi:hypothetical protein AKJ39_02435 [candidate division MSBL1 archaeon SCGC-AAA259J03]|uniref:5-oxoprolinase n=1 Tax=candidate division MSBL1 archaeon SCGC-AAA259J03 TaxID=1698269 RepID=A0A656YW99_9EURY|nr:hypothetical protein AKJ39_02435 [candidate division MSBL1 archaeon SCGC-AAA259J03]